MLRRDYCKCTMVRNYDYGEAAEKLRCKRRWLEENISRLPHQKLGQSPAFCDCELALIQSMFTVLPAGVLDLLQAGNGQTERPEPEQRSVHPLASIRPSGPRRGRAVS
ncbi:hypothetical protein AB0K47_01190 [Streptomyces tirandamycinicus]|uniref:Uncharacterized protein n=1 Tax=Streptomyces spongiicola TaxID=1690221 RepID=A0ABN5KIA5_9ACTN|nr:hypothetical protein [Streptomyces spongiicola]AWK10023.1 hypothetical protein DDQ41_15220 [Streptomyces spongiicola]